MEDKQLIAKALLPVIGEHLSEEEIKQLIEVPTHSEFGDYAVPVFQLARVYRKAPQAIAEEIVEEMDTTSFKGVTAVGPYINFQLKREEVVNELLHKILDEDSNYGKQDIGHGRNVPIDMSSPNIAKPMSMGHLRSTVIGNALANILTKLSYKVIRINHLGDWGTQFGKLIVAYQDWGSEELVRQDPVAELVKLYVEFHERAEEDPELDERARAAFKALEDGDPEMRRLWQWFRDESLKEFDKVYRMLGIEFDSYKGEAFYNDKMDEPIQVLEDLGLLEVENGASLVHLDDETLPPALIRKSDGATLYITRDLATALYRMAEYDFVQSLYVVGGEQTVHFKQLKEVLKLMGHEWADWMHHIPFGLITLGGKKLSTRQGKIVLLEDVLNEAIDLAYEQIELKNPSLENKKEVAEEVGVGAVVFHDLKSERLNNFDFQLEDIVQFEGETGPYVQYANARCHSLLGRSDVALDLVLDYSLSDDESWEVIRLLQHYPHAIRRAGELYEPSVIAKYLIQLAQAFNRYYAKVRILDEDSELQARLALVKAVSIVLTDGLGLLGVQAPEKM